MKRRILDIALLLGCFTNVFSSGYYSGTYLAVGAGLIDNVFTFSQTATVDDVSKTAISNSSGGDELSFNGTISAGYRADIINSFNIGIEFDASFENAQIDSSASVANADSLTTSNHIQTKLSDSFAILFKPGMTFNSQKTLLYFLTGPEWGDFSANSSTAFIDSSSDNHATSAMAASLASTYKSGWAFGVGAEQYLNDDFHIGIEYQYVEYGTIYDMDTTGNVITSGATTGSMTGNATTDAHTSSIIIKIIKQFR